MRAVFLLYTHGNYVLHCNKIVATDFAQGIYQKL